MREFLKVTGVKPYLIRFGASIFSDVGTDVRHGRVT
jgi:hypothetical protein